jgi:hypothetical protein
MNNVISNIHVLGECSAVPPVCPSEDILNPRSISSVCKSVQFMELIDFSGVVSGTAKETDFLHQNSN